ncbi:hypothetical protein BS756_00335, partial [Staphylococcus sp. MB371]
NILKKSSTTNGKVSQKSYKEKEDTTGMTLQKSASERASKKITLQNRTEQPREVIPTAVIPGSTKLSRRNSPFTTNFDRLVPFRTLTGRQSYYIDHEVFVQCGENLPIYKPTLPQMGFGTKDKNIKRGVDTLVFRYLPPHGKCNIHSTYQD